MWNVIESGINQGIFLLLDGYFVTWAILEQLPDWYILTLDVLAFHPILHAADLKDEERYSILSKNYKLAI